MGLDKIVECKWSVIYKKDLWNDKLQRNIEAYQCNKCSGYEIACKGYEPKNKTENYLKEYGNG